MTAGSLVINEWRKTSDGYELQVGQHKAVVRLKKVRSRSRATLTWKGKEYDLGTRASFDHAERIIRSEGVGIMAGTLREYRELAGIDPRSRWALTEAPLEHPTIPAAAFPTRQKTHLRLVTPSKRSGRWVQTRDGYEFDMGAEKAFVQVTKMAFLYWKGRTYKLSMAGMKREAERIIAAT